MKKTSFVFACGGSGGHIFPAVAVAEEISRRRPDASITFISGGKGIEDEIFRGLQGARVVTLGSPAGKSGGPLWHPNFLLKLFKEVKTAQTFLKAEKPDVVVGFGGHGSFPVVMAARFCGIPTVIHEQNVVPGLANRLLSPVADGVALSFDETRLGGRRRRTTGNPIRCEIERDCRQEALRFFGFSPQKKTVLVLGGSQGAESVNTLFMEAARLLPEAVKGGIQVLHLCGRMSPQDSEARFGGLGIAAKSYSFFNRMDLAYGAADLAVGRAGATFLAEMEARRLPAILVPYPYAGGHQLENARVVARRAAAVVAEQKDLDGERLAALLVSQVGRLGGAENAPRTAVGPDPARQKLTDFILEMIDTR